MDIPFLFFSSGEYVGHLIASGLAPGAHRILSYTITTNAKCHVMFGVNRDGAFTPFDNPIALYLDPGSCAVKAPGSKGIGFVLQAGDDLALLIAPDALGTTAAVAGDVEIS
jgi:hypothetical protein